MKRAIAGIVIIMSLALAAIGQPHAYGFTARSAHAGVMIGDCYHFNVGIEVKGSPGPYMDQC